MRTKQMADRFREVILNGKWIANTNIEEQLSDVGWQQATTRIGSLNTLAVLTFHINYYIAGLINVFEGGSLDIRDKYSFDMPAVESQEDWTQLRDTLLVNAEKFAGLVEAMPDEILDDAFVDEKYGTYQRNIEGMIEHVYYHFGQITLIKKLVLAG
ncbi:MAG: DUF1572 domain-containing protein [Saprospiraceae bacterium]|nr:DUF1572 domain-containing protein [Lewinella sp.]